MEKLIENKNKGTTFKNRYTEWRSQSGAIRTIFAQPHGTWYK